jgi:hypothetical protein
VDLVKIPVPVGMWVLTPVLIGWGRPVPDGKGRVWFRVWIGKPPDGRGKGLPVGLPVGTVMGLP